MKRSLASRPSQASVLSRASLLPERGGRKEKQGFLCFTLGDEEYGVDLNLVHQIVKLPAVTFVPRIAPYILGIISIRGAVVTLLDLRQLMGLAPSIRPRTTRVLIVEHEDEHVGLLVDSVTQVRRIGQEQLEKELGFGDSQRSDYLLFVARPQPDKLVVIVDLNTILEERLR